MDELFANIKADFDAFVGSANDVINKTKGTNMKKLKFRPTPKQETLWKTYQQIVQNYDMTLGDKDGQHELNQDTAIRQLALITGRTEGDIRGDITLTCIWLNDLFAKEQ